MNGLYFKYEIARRRWKDGKPMTYNTKNAAAPITKLVKMEESKLKKKSKKKGFLKLLD